MTNDKKKIPQKQQTRRGRKQICQQKPSFDKKKFIKHELKPSCEPKFLEMVDLTNDESSDDHEAKKS